MFTQRDIPKHRDGFSETIGKVIKVRAYIRVGHHTFGSTYSRFPL